MTIAYSDQHSRCKLHPLSLEDGLHQPAGAGQGWTQEYNGVYRGVCVSRMRAYANKAGEDGGRGSRRRQQTRGRCGRAAGGSGPCRPPACVLARPWSCSGSPGSSLPPRAAHQRPFLTLHLGNMSNTDCQGISSITGVPHLCQTLYHSRSPQLGCCKGLLQEVLFNRERMQTCETKRAPK